MFDHPYFWWIAAFTIGIQLAEHPLTLGILIGAQVWAFTLWVIDTYPIK